MTLKVERFSPRKERGFFARALPKHKSSWTMYLEESSRKTLQLAVVVKKSTIKKATERNALRRKVRSFFERTRINDSQVGKKAVIVWRKKSPPTEVDFQNMYETVFPANQ